MKHGLSLLVLLFSLGVAHAQVQPQQAALKPSPSAEALEMWERVGRMLIDMAEQFPEDTYGYKPVPEVRSFKEQVLHVAGANYFFIRLAGGTRTKPSHVGRETKADVIAVLKESFSDGAALIRQLGDDGMAQMVKHPFEDHRVSLHRSWTLAAGHGGEHYGQLVVYYRLNGLVPPTTIQQQAPGGQR